MLAETIVENEFVIDGSGVLDAKVSVVVEGSERGVEFVSDSAESSISTKINADATAML